MLLGLLQKRPWLLVLDGLERVLVAYHRFDAAQLVDEEAGRTDEIAHRDPCAAIRPEDDYLLRALAGALPSKLILTSRLVPRVLLNSAGQTIPGVVRVPLPGLRPPDAEALLRACGVSGNSQDIQHYLKNHCDCHPLVTGVLAGLINDYLLDRGNFDAWAADAAYGGQLNLAALDLVQKRNHILHTALAALSDKSRQLLSTLALISEAVDYPILSALNPHLPPAPKEVEEPEDPKNRWDWDILDGDIKDRVLSNYEIAVQRRREYERAVLSRMHSPEFLAGPHELTKTVRDLERRGLLQYDAQTKRHDLHPVVRSIAANGLKLDARNQYGQRVVDYFSKQDNNPYGQAETLEDLRNGLQVVRTLLHMGRYQEACDAYSSDLANALTINLEANTEKLSLLRPFFPHGWSMMPEGLEESDASFLANSAGLALSAIGEAEEALTLFGASLLSQLRRKMWPTVITRLDNLSMVLGRRLAKKERCRLLALEIATLINSNISLFLARLSQVSYLMIIGRWDEAESLWKIVDAMGRNWSPDDYISGGAEYTYAWLRFYRGELTEEVLGNAESLVRSSKNRPVIRALHRLRGDWHILREEWKLAADSFGEAIRMAREVGRTAESSETRLALIKFKLNQLPNPHEQAEQIASAQDLDHQALAELWFAIGEADQSKKEALKAYEEAWADGEPYVYRYALDRARALLEQLGAPIPDLPAFNPGKYEKLPWEDELVAAVDKLRADTKAQKESKNASQTNGDD